MAALKLSVTPTSERLNTRETVDLGGDTSDGLKLWTILTYLLEDRDPDEASVEPYSVVALALKEACSKLNHGRLGVSPGRK